MNMDAVTLKIIAAAAALLYYTAFALSLSKKSGKTAMRIFPAAGFAANLFLVVNNYLVNGYVPFVSMYQVLTFLGICFLPIYIYMRFVRDGGWMAPYFIFVPAVIMTGLVFMEAKSAWEFAPALQSPWFVPHVLVYMIAYTMGAVIFLISVAGLFAKKPEDRLQKENGAYDCACIMYPFLTMGMFFGAIWANEVWGHFWSWDIKEIWALMTWLVYTLYLHFRRDKKLKKFAPYLAILGFVGIIVTFFFVNIISSGVHSYSTNQ